MTTIINRIIGDLKKYSDPVYQKSVQRFFLEPIKCYGARKDTVKKIAKLYWLEVKDKPKKEIFALCKELLEIGYMETSIIAFQWALLLKKDYELSDFKVFESWLSKYVTNWALCDDLCGGALGILLKQYPELIDKTESWVRSKNRWMRRASVVCMIYAGLTRDQLPIIFNRCAILLIDEDPMIQKGYGWLLKKAADRYQKEVFDFVIKNKNNMPRTALRYAIEKMPAHLKRQAMEK
jgi:3-methyladenine DNA glycosylase AlkD